MNIFSKKEEKNSLFNGNDKYFKDLLVDSICYVEFGAGESTLWALDNTDTRVVSVETSKLWVNELKNRVPIERDWHAVHVNVGKLGEWGRPVGLGYRSRFIYYAMVPWRLGYSPDTVLIDGRFRVLCFLVCLLYAKSGTKIIFDDYCDREHYHVCEEYLKPGCFYGRQALFEVPPFLKRGEAIRKEIIKFSYVVD